MKVEDEILEHLGMNKTFPRDIGFSQKISKRERFRKPVYGDEEYVYKVLARRFSSDCYVSLYSHDMKKNDIIDKNFCDVDNADLEKSRTRTLKIYNWFRETFDIEPRVYFSGSKGFHIITDFPEVCVTPEAHYFFNYMVYMVTEAPFDIGIASDKNRVSRIPYTHNIGTYSKKGEIRMCIPVDPNDTLHAILQSAKPFRKGAFAEPISIQPSREVAKLMNKLNQDIKPDEEVVFIDSKVGSSGWVDVVKFLARKSREIQDGRHRLIHFVIVPNLIWLGWEAGEIIKFCRDFIKETGGSFAHYKDYTEKSIYRTLEGPMHDYSRPWKPWSLETLKSYYPDLKGMV